MTEADPIVELEQLAGGPVVGKTYGGLAVRISPLLTEEFGPMLRAVEPMFDELVVIADDPTVGDLMRIFTRHSESFLSAVCIAARVDRQWLNKQTLDIPLELFADVLVCNRDFFAVRLQQVVFRLQTIFSAGSTSSSASSAPATDSTT